MISYLKRLWQEKPLLCIIIIAIVPRLLAAFFSKGYGMHDDHFGPIEQPFQIINDITYWTSRTTPHGHSIVYPLIHFAIMKIFNYIGITDPQNVMIFIRLFHALFSLLIVYFGFKIVEKLSTLKAAKLSGIILALFWLFPFLSVRNLIEFVCIPPLMGAVYFIFLKEKKYSFLIAGILFGVSFIFRYQTLIIPVTIFFIFLFKKEYLKTFYLMLGAFISIILIQGSADIFAWGYPLAAFITYFGYNATHSGDYTSGPWYNYLLLIFGILIPPFSLLILYTFARTWKKHLIIFLPVIIFFIFHSYFPNKQERFILPVVPFIIILGVIGYVDYIDISKFWQSHKKLLNGLWIWFWIINTVLLIPFTFHYSKKSRVESSYFLRDKNVTGLIVSGGKIGSIMLPLFYMNKYPVQIYEVNDVQSITMIKDSILRKNINPNYIVLFGKEDLETRIINFENILGKKFIFEKSIKPSLVDDVLFKLNPVGNKNQASYIYKIIN